MATYDIILPLPKGWSGEQERYEDEDGALVTHIECHLDGSNVKDSAALDIYAGDMPEDMGAEDQAYANYADIIGWDDDEDDEDPIARWMFRGRKAYGFSGECEDGSIMLLMCVEFRKGCLLICSAVAADDDKVGEIIKYIEENIKVNVLK